MAFIPENEVQSLVPTRVYNTILQKRTNSQVIKMSYSFFMLKIIVLCAITQVYHVLLHYRAV